MSLDDTSSNGAEHAQSARRIRTASASWVRSKVVSWLVSGLFFRVMYPQVVQVEAEEDNNFLDCIQVPDTTHPSSRLTFSHPSWISEHLLLQLLRSTRQPRTITNEPRHESLLAPAPHRPSPATDHHQTIPVGLASLMNWFGHLPPPIWTSGSQFQDCLYCNSQGITGGYPSLQSYYGVSGMGMGFGGFGEGGMHGMHGMHGMPGIHGAHGMPGMPGMAMGGMMSMGMPVMGHPGMGVPAFYTSKTSEDKDDEDTDPFDYDWYGNPVGFATEKRHLRWHLAHSINQTNLLVDPQTHASIQALLDSG